MRLTGKVATFAASASVIALGSVAWAANDEIVVTAQKREQNLQDVPISITALDREGLQANRVEGLEDLGKIAPGVYVTPNPADNNGVRVNIRGIGTFDPQIGQDSRVAIYQDGVYLGKTQGLAFDLPDLDRIEILKGPQGTLYGRNSVAGAINLISKAPSGEEFSGNLSAEYGNFDHKRFQGAFNLPLGRNFGMRVSGLYMDRDGWVENDGPGTDFAGSEKYGIRVAVGGEPNDITRIDLAFDWNKTKNEPLFYQSVTDVPNPGAFAAAAVGTFDGGRQEEVTTAFAPEEGENETLGVSLTGKFDLRENDNLKVTIAYREVDSRRFVTLVPTANPAILNAISAGFDQALAPLPFAFQAAGQSVRADWNDQFGPGAAPNTGLFLSAPGGAAVLDGHNQLSIEGTYNGEFADGRVTYTGGAFYFSEETGTGSEQASLTDINSYLFVLGAFSPGIPFPSLTQPDPFPDLGPIPQSLAHLGILSNPMTPPAVAGQAAQDLRTVIGFPGNPSPLAGATVYEQLANARQSAGNQLFIDTNAWAIYGQLTFNVTDQLRITGGIRYSNESKDGRGQSVSPFFLDNIDLVGNVIEPNRGEIDFDVFNPSAIVEFDATEDILLYASFKQSFRSGGFNAAAVGTPIPGETFSPDFLFGREDINAYEAGFKADLADNRLRINAAGFFYDFKDQQTTVALNPLIATSRAVVNTDEEIWGFEVDTVLSFVDGWSLNASYSYIDGDAGDVTNPLTGAVEMRDELQGTPQNSFLVGLNFDQPIAPNAKLFGSASYSYKDDVLSIPQDALRLTDQNLVTARVGVDFEIADGRNAFIAVWGENLLDDEYTIDSLPFETFAYRTRVFGQPRTYGFTVGMNF